jgi:hypothetical protein
MGLMYDYTCSNCGYKAERVGEGTGWFNVLTPVVCPEDGIVSASTNLGPNGQEEAPRGPHLCPKCGRPSPPWGFQECPRCGKSTMEVDPDSQIHFD